MNEFEKKIAEIVGKAESEKRSLTDAELTDIDGIKAAMAKAETAKKEAVTQAVQQRSAATARFTVDKDVNEASAYFRSIAKSGADVGNHEVVNDVVRQYNQTSPIFAAHANVQKRSTGNSYSFTQITLGGAGYVKTEGQAGTTDSSSAAPLVSLAFSTFSGQKVLVTQEALDDYAADISNEIMTLGLAKSTLAFGTACVNRLKQAFGGNGTGGGSFNPTETEHGVWHMDDVVAAYYEIPVRNRKDVKFICNSATAQELVNLLTLDDSPRAAAIGLTPANIVEDDAMDDYLLFVGNITLAPAIGMKIPVRTVALEVSEGTTYEVQPRFAVGLRDGTAVAARQLLPTDSTPA